MLPPAWTVALAVIAAGYLAARSVRAWRARSIPMRSPASAVVLGVDRDGHRVTLEDRQAAAHGLILGASGSGKSTTLLRILTEQIRRGAPVVALDLKGSPAFAGRLAEAAHEAGRPFRLWTPDGPGHWNPVQHGNPTELKDKLIATERFTEPHYQRAAERYLQTVLQVLEHGRSGPSTTLDEVVRLMDLRRLKGALRAVPRPLAERVQDYVEDLPRDQLSAIRGLATRLAILTESHTGRYLAPAAGPADPTIDLRTALAGPEVVVFSLNSSSYGNLAAQLGTLVLQDLVSAAGERLGSYRHPQPATAVNPPAFVAIDEFSALGAAHVLALIARGRESGVSVVLATQELADLQSAAPWLRDQILGNSAIKIVHRQEVPGSAQTVAQMVGTEWVWEETRQIGGPLLGRFDTGRGTRRQVEQFVIHPNEITALGQGEAVVITKVPTSSVRITHITPPRPLTRATLPSPEPGPARAPLPDRVAKRVAVPRARAPANRSGAARRRRNPPSADPRAGGRSLE